MLILLPPSEGKRRDDAPGRALDWTTLSHPELNPARRRVLEALEAASARPDAREVLGVGPALADEVKANIGLAGRAARPAAQLYSGVLYEALGLGSLGATAAGRADRELLVFSALWGVLRPADRIPPYRLAVGVALPGPGRLGAFWRAALAETMDRVSAGRLVVDCRSTGYQAMWPVPPDRGVTVRVVRERDGVRSVVSHLAKHSRGRLARFLLTRRGAEPATPEQLRAVAARHRGWRAELSPASGRAAARLTLVLRDR